jgi:hypothetical protein
MFLPSGQVLFIIVGIKVTALVICRLSFVFGLYLGSFLGKA